MKYNDLQRICDMKTTELETARKAFQLWATNQFEPTTIDLRLGAKEGYEDDWTNAIWVGFCAGWTFRGL